jgi:hypothetical protein
LLNLVRRAEHDTKAFGGPRARSGIAAIVATLAFFGWSGAAAAQTEPPPPPDDGSAIDEYVEEIPSSSGGVAPGAGEKKTKPLPAPVSAQLSSEAGEDAVVLREVATSSDAGAPQVELTRPGDREAAIGDAADDGSSPLSAAVSAVSGGSGGRVVGLVVVLVLVTGTALGAAVYWHRHAER